MAKAEWISRLKVQNLALSAVLQTSLDQGEAEVIALAEEIEADLLLLDEKSARGVAERLKYPVLGTIGILIWAKKQGFFPSLANELSLLRRKGGFRLGSIVYGYALLQVGE